MRKVRELQYLKKFFWDYNFEKLSELKIAQRIVDFWSSVIDDFDKDNLKKQDFLLILSLIKKNFEKIEFKNSVKKGIIKRLVEKIN